VQTLDLEEAVVVGDEDAWEAATLMPKGLEHSVMHRYKMVKGKWSGREVEL